MCDRATILAEMKVIWPLQRLRKAQTQTDMDANAAAVNESGEQDCYFHIEVE